MKLNLKNPKHNQFVAYYLCYYFWSGSTDLLWDWYTEADTEDLGDMEKLAKEIFKEFKIETEFQMDLFIKENSSVLFDETRIIWSCKTK